MNLAFTVLIIAVALVVVTVPLRSMCVVPPDHARNVERRGRYHRTLSRPGRHFVVPFVDVVGEPIDLREQVVSVTRELVITEDNLVVEINTRLHLEVVDPRAAAYEVTSSLGGIEELTVLALRDVIGAMPAERALAAADTMTSAVRAMLAERAEGIRVNRVEITAIGPPKTIEYAKEQWERKHRPPAERSG